MNNTNQFSYENNKGTVIGSFFLSQSPSGSIVLRMGEHFTELMHGQIHELNLVPQRLKHFDPKSYHAKYHLNEKTKDRFDAILNKTVDKVMDNLFYDLHRMAHTKHGDIDPTQHLELEYLLHEFTQLKERLCKVLQEQVLQNMDLKPNQN